MRSTKSYREKASSATERDRDDDRLNEEFLPSGEKRKARIQPSPNPANKKVTAVGRSYAERFLVSVNIIFSQHNCEVHTDFIFVGSNTEKRKITTQVFRLSKQTQTKGALGQKSKDHDSGSMLSI